MEYINKLSYENLIIILNRCGLFVTDDEEYYINLKHAEKNGELDCYYFRAMDCDESKQNENILKNKFINEKLNNFNCIKFDENTLNFSYLQNKVDIYMVSDFILCRACPINTLNNEFPNQRDFELQDKFISVMSKTFKNKNYAKQYEDFVENQFQNSNNNEINLKNL